MLKFLLQATAATIIEQAKLKAAAERKFGEVIKNKLYKSAWKIVNRAQMQYLTIDPLHVVNNRLRPSVKATKPEQIGSEYITKIGTNVYYGRMWEEGFSKKGKVFSPRPWLRPAFDDMMPEIKEDMQSILRESVE
jgi:hypothetical protein